MASEQTRERLRDRFRGALLGTMAGDALGMPVEGMSAGGIRLRYGQVRDMQTARLGRGTYTDDTQMMIGLAEALLDAGGALDPDTVAVRFAEGYEPDRGYGGNAARILERIRSGVPWREAVAALTLPGGSFANGAAMRVAPVALASYPDRGRVLRAAGEQARVTGHTHPLGCFGAGLQATAVLEACRAGRLGEPFPLATFLGEALADAPGPYGDALGWIEGNLGASPEDAVTHLGNGGLAVSSVPAALWAFLSCVEDPEETIVRAVNLGGDTDTIGAMAGALAGAYHGEGALPSRWIDVLEGGARGRDYVRELGDRLLGLVWDRIG